MLNIEPYFAELAMSLTEMRKPVTSSLIHDSSIPKKLIVWKRGYRALEFCDKCTEQCTYIKMEEIHTEIYKILCAAWFAYELKSTPISSFLLTLMVRHINRVTLFNRIFKA
jgi:hypothetical protein